MSLDIQKQMQSNFIHFCCVLNQKKIEFKDLQGNNHQGIVQNVTPAQETLLVKSTSQNTQPLKLWKFDQIGFLKLSQIAKFKIDSDTVKAKDRKAKTLVKWIEEDDKPDLEVQLDALPQNHFDQFEANLERFGVLATYDENSYTTELKLNQVNERLRDFAEQQAYELSRNLQGEKNRHVLEERNLKPLQDEDDEEAKYSAVIGSGKYKNTQKKGNNKGKNKNKFPPGLSQGTKTPKQEEAIPEPSDSTNKSSPQGVKFFNSNKNSISDSVEEKLTEELQDITDKVKQIIQKPSPLLEKEKLPTNPQVMTKTIIKKSLKLPQQQIHQDSFLSQLDPKKIGQDQSTSSLQKQPLRLQARPYLNQKIAQAPQNTQQYNIQNQQFPQQQQYQQYAQSYPYQNPNYPPQNQQYNYPQNQQYWNNSSPYYQDYQQMPNQYQYPYYEQYPQQESYQYQLPPPPHNDSHQ